MADTVRIQVLIEDVVDGVEFRDASYFKDMAEYESRVSDGSFAAERERRIENFRKVKNAKPIEPTLEELLSEKATLANQIAELDSKIKDMEIAKK